MELICKTSLSLQERVIRASLALGLLLGLLTVSLVQPASIPFAGCAFHSLTGHSCLTCGMTRSLHAMAHGDLAASVRYHLFGPAVFLLMLLSCMIFAAQAISGKEPAIRADRKLRIRVFLLFAIAWITYWGVRLAGEFSR